MSLRTHRLLLLSQLAAAALILPRMTAAEVTGSSGPLIRSARSGAWSAPGTWEGGKVPGLGASVQVREDVAGNVEKTPHVVSIEISR